MRIVVSGGRGRLGTLVVPALRTQGHTVSAPSRSELEWTDEHAVHDAIRAADAVLALASWTDVPGAQADPAACVRDTVGTTEATLRAAARCGAVVHYVSSDYVMPLLRAEPVAGVYAAAKLVAEQRVLDAEGGRHRVARVAFVTLEQARRWLWVDGVSVAHRLWADELVPHIVVWMEQRGQGERLVHLGAAQQHTLADLLRRRCPRHPALARVVTDPAELARLTAMPRPADSTWAGQGKE